MIVAIVKNVSRILRAKLNSHVYFQRCIGVSLVSFANKFISSERLLPAVGNELAENMFQLRLTVFESSALRV